MIRRILSAAACAAAAGALLSCGGAGRSPLGDPGGPSDPADAFDSPAPWPGPQWSLNGEKVDHAVISTAAGPSHCGSQSATFLHIGWPLGTRAQTSAQARQYIRDRTGAVRSPYLLGPLDLNARIPADAQPTGFTYGRLSIHVGSDAGRSIYVAGRHRVERWPRSDPMTLCA